MAWTYDPTLPDSQDEVRYMVGDTDTTDQLIQDGSIEVALIRFPPGTGKPPWLAAANVCDAIAGAFSRKAQQSLGPLSLAAQQQWEHYKAMAQDFRVLYATNGKGIVTGSMAGVVVAGPVLGGGGKTYLGSNPYLNQHEGA